MPIVGCLIIFDDIFWGINKVLRFHSFKNTTRVNSLWNWQVSIGRDVILEGKVSVASINRGIAIVMRWIVVEQAVIEFVVEDCLYRLQARDGIVKQWQISSS